MWENRETGAAFEYRSSQPMPTGSLIKLPVMIEAYWITLFSSSA
ncbi:MAG: serine hydrolase [Planctomycetes bacterium]|nr:serine hydrolase [Planctomycetota bacterium]